MHPATTVYLYSFSLVDKKCQSKDLKAMCSATSLLKPVGNAFSNL